MFPISDIIENVLQLSEDNLISHVDYQLFSIVWKLLDSLLDIMAQIKNILIEYYLNFNTNDFLFIPTFN